MLETSTSQDFFNSFKTISPGLELRGGLHRNGGVSMSAFDGSSSLLGHQGLSEYYHSSQPLVHGVERMGILHDVHNALVCEDI